MHAGQYKTFGQNDRLENSTRSDVDGFVIALRAPVLKPTLLDIISFRLNDGSLTSPPRRTEFASR